mgnify:CR=1 FL=1
MYYTTAKSFGTKSETSNKKIIFTIFHVYKHKTISNENIKQKLLVTTLIWPPRWYSG